MRCGREPPRERGRLARIRLGTMATNPAKVAWRTLQGSGLDGRLLAGIRMRAGARPGARAVSPA